MKKYLINILKYLYRILYPSYNVSVNNSRGSILVSYLTEPFFKRNNLKYLNGHQNRRETLIISEILTKLNFSQKFVRLDGIMCRLSGYNIIFGAEPNFVSACKKNPNAIKIYYATGAFYKHQDNMVVSRTDEFNRIHSANIVYSRRPAIHNSCEIADYIFQIGSRYTLETYPESIRKKIILIRQTCHNFKFENFMERKLRNNSITDFVWMGTGGSILKGLDIVLDYFMIHEEYILHVLGPIDQDVMDYYKPKLKNHKNIKLYGYVDMDSQLLEQIALKSTFTIMLSGSEGCPGAVINMMKLGCIPIVSKYSAFDGLDEVGYIVNELSTNGLHNAIEVLSNQSSEELNSRMLKASNLANNTFNIDSFKNDLYNSFNTVINKI